MTEHDNTIIANPIIINPQTIYINDAIAIDNINENENIIYNRINSFINAVLSMTGFIICIILIH